MRIQDFKEFLNLLNPEEFEKVDARDLVNQLVDVHSRIENVLSEFGVHHQIYIYLGEERNGGKWLVLEDDEDDYYGPPQEAGQWKSSAGTC